MEQNNKRIAKNTVILAIQQGLSLIVGLYASRVILQSLGIEDFGVYNVVAGFVTMFAFLNTSMTNAIQRFYNYEYGRNGEEGANIVFNNAILIQIVLSGIVIILLETIGVWYIYHKLVIPAGSIRSVFWVFQFSAFSLIMLIMQIPFSAAIAAHERMLCFALISILDSILKLLVAIAIKYVSGDKLTIYGFLVFLISVSDIIIYITYAVRNFPEIRIKFAYNWKILKEMLSFSGWNFFGSLAGVAKEQGVNVILNLFFGPIVNAARGIAYQVGGALKSFVSTVMISGRPQLIQSYAQMNYDRTIQLMFILSKASYLILLIFSIPVMFNINYILHLWLSTDLPDYTGTFVNLVIVMSLIESLSPPVSFAVHASGRMAKYQVVNSLITILILPISYMCLKHGASAVSVFWLGILFQILNQISSVIILKGIITYSIKAYLKSVIIPLIIISCIVAFIILIICQVKTDSLIMLIITSFASIIIIFAASYYLALDKIERIGVLTFIKSQINK